MQIVLQIRFDSLRIKCGLVRFQAQEMTVQMNETFVDDIHIAAAIVALSRRAVRKHVVNSNQIVAPEPILVFFRHISQKDQNRKAATQLKLLDSNPCGPVVPLIDTVMVGIDIEYAVWCLLQKHVHRILRRIFHFCRLVPVNRGKVGVCVAQLVGVIKVFAVIEQCAGFPERRL